MGFERLRVLKWVRRPNGSYILLSFRHDGGLPARCSTQMPGTATPPASLVWQVNEFGWLSGALPTVLSAVFPLPARDRRQVDSSSLRSFLACQTCAPAGQVGEGGGPPRQDEAN